MAYKGTMMKAYAKIIILFIVLCPSIVMAQDDLLNDFGTQPALPPPLERLEALEDTQVDANPAQPPAPLSSTVAQEAQEQLKEKAREETYERAVEQLMPLRPEEIRELLRRFSDNREAVETPIDPYPEPKTHVANVSLDPSFPPPVILTAPGHVTTLSVLDSTGSAWAIQDISWAGNFDVVASNDGALGPTDEGGHIVRITPLSAHGGGNLSMRLIGLNTPITFTLRTQNEIAHYRFDVRVPGFGPRARIPLIQGGNIQAVAGGGFLTSVLDGTPPSDAELMNVSGVDGRTRVWKLGDQMYVRTPHTLLSPRWTDSVTSSDGTNVYSLSMASVLLMSEGGEIMRAHISDFNEEALP